MVMRDAKVEIVHILIAVAICEVGVVDGGREKVSPDILCSVISAYDAFQPSAVVRGVDRSQSALGNVLKVRLIGIVRAAGGGIIVQSHFIC